MWIKYKNKLVKVGYIEVSRAYWGSAKYALHADVVTNNWVGPRLYITFKTKEEALNLQSKIEDAILNNEKMFTINL